ncbi:MAG TPA: lysozyme inhibitor LprI family protein [Xanthomonadaceae bacterium]
MEHALRKTMPAIAASLSHRSRIGLVALLSFVVGACDATPPTSVTATGATVKPASAAPSCPSKDLAGFVAAFAESPSLQKAFTAPVVDTAFVDWNAQPEPAESVEQTSRDALRFPVMPDRARQQTEGLRYREIGSEGDRTTIVLEVPDTDTQLRYTFRRDACWTLVKIVDPAFGKAFGGKAADDDLTGERDRQDARLNTIYTQLIGQLQGERRERIVAAQRAWVQLQEKDDAFEASLLDGLGPTGHRQKLENKASAIAQRADLLVSIADFAGDVRIDDTLRAPQTTAVSDSDNYVPQGLSVTLAQCMAGAAGTLAQAECLTDERERQDARLNTIYKQLIGRLQGERRDRMVTAQRAWVQLQQSDGDVRESILDGIGQVGNLQSVENDARAICQRADLLQRHLDMGKR